ncbi:MAG: sugar phosphate isomerase/epimerase family protein [Anaerolineae bacterium]
MRLGIGTYSYMWAIGFEGARPERPLSAIGLLEKARQLGVHLVQVGPNLPLGALSDTDLDAFVQRAQEWGIELELGTRGIETAHLTEQVRLARRIGATLLRTIPEVGGDSPEPADIPGYLRAIRPLLEGEGVRLGLENGKLPAEQLRGALDAVPSPNLGVILDTVNSLAVPEGWRYVTQVLAPYTNCLHLKEFVVQRLWNMMGFTVEGRPAGQGQVDVPWLLETLRAAGAHFNVVLELWPPQQPTLAETIAMEQAWNEASVAYMRQFVQD